jgi:deoxycytidine triphosphate deaminase
MIVCFEKYMAKQDVTNDYIKQMVEQNHEFMENFDEKLEVTRKELEAKIDVYKEEQDKRYLELKLENKDQTVEVEKSKVIDAKEKTEEIKESKTNTGTWVKWIVGTIIAGLGVYSAFIK